MMSWLDAFVAHFFYSVGMLACLFGFARHAKYRLGDSLTLLLLIFAVVLFGYTLLFLLLVVFLPLDKVLKAKPTPGWRQDVETVDVAIVLGFGYKKKPDSTMNPGEANEKLLTWTLENTKTDIILVQEGIWVAACDSDAETCTKSGRQILRIHQHCEGIYLNTLDTAFCAMELLEILGKKEAVLVTHDLQLQRAAWDFEAVRQSNERWHDMRFVIPKMPDIPYPKHSIHLQTRSEWLWRICELMIARPRDYLNPIPQVCKAPISDIAN